MNHPSLLVKLRCVRLAYPGPTWARSSQHGGTWPTPTGGHASRGGVVRKGPGYASPVNSKQRSTPSRKPSHLEGTAALPATTRSRLTLTGVGSVFPSLQDHHHPPMLFVKSVRIQTCSCETRPFLQICAFAGRRAALLHCRWRSRAGQTMMCSPSFSATRHQDPVIRPCLVFFCGFPPPPPPSSAKAPRESDEAPVAGSGSFAYRTTSEPEGSTKAKTSGKQCPPGCFSSTMYGTV